MGWLGSLLRKYLTDPKDAINQHLSAAWYFLKTGVLSLFKKNCFFSFFFL
jgi:hypothetical protein